MEPGRARVAACDSRRFGPGFAHEHDLLRRTATLRPHALNPFIRGKAVDSAPLALGRPAGAWRPLRRGRGPGPGRPRWREILVERLRLDRTAAALGEARGLEHPHGPVERDRDHITSAHGLAARGHALAVEAHMPGFDQRGGGAARTYHARVPQPLVDALAVQGRLLSDA